MARKQQEGGKGVLEDKKQFERSAADQKLSHMGDKPKGAARDPAARAKSPRKQDDA
jgi:hypothetical protein